MFSGTVSMSNMILTMLPNIRGSTIIKEKLVAFLRSTPNKTALAIVEPLLEIPGRMATD